MGNCCDTAVMERFFLSFKTERVWQRDYANHTEATSHFADYVVVFYNSVRLHSKLGNLPPNALERQSASINLSRWPKKIDQHMFRCLKFHRPRLIKQVVYGTPPF